MNKILNILVVEDSQMFAEGLKSNLTNKENIGEIDFALNYQECFDQLKWKKHGLVILDINFDEEYTGIDIAKKIKSLYPNVKILVLTQLVKLEYYKPLMKEVKVNGYLDKKLGKEALFEAIDNIMNGGIQLDDSIESMMNIKNMMFLTDQEKEIIELAGQGLTYKEIADKIHLSDKSVDYHLRKLVLKTDSKNTVELVRKYNSYKHSNREQSEWK